MPSETQQNALSTPLRLVAGVLFTGFLGLGIAEIIAPADFIGTYGAPTTGTEGLPFINAVGARNIALSLIGIFAAARGLRSTLALTFLGLTIVSALEFYVVSMAAGPMAAIRFAVFAVLLALLALWTVRSRGPGS